MALELPQSSRNITLKRVTKLFCTTIKNVCFRHSYTSPPSHRSSTWLFCGLSNGCTYISTNCSCDMV
ncbi:hypothetical protein GWI33_005617 [Rhynchophorus ferrugineus]|uniref:Uncharacterized protein n=1 Tax=Rhynchophorus ferrugineus TaxID=354439 RepID=A0A834MHU6_RHYFE|nr:hypothetical protein GWI33_005617 [Rhynchophorus ferrugineus]